MRWWFAIKEGFAQRKALKQFLVDPLKQIGSLEEITAKSLDDQGIAVLILDFDGVLAAHDELEPAPDVAIWLRKLSLEIGEQRIALFSNKPKPERIRYFKSHFPSIHFVQEVRKKPYPDGILEVANYRGVPMHRVMLVDDRLLTGMLATCLAYSQGKYLRKPMRNLWRRPIKEIFFSFLRVFERGVFKTLS